MQCRPVLDARDYGIVPRAGDVTVILALASVAAACNRHPQLATTTVLINGSRTWASNFVKNTDYNIIQVDLKM